jgi:butyryl-CoA dehydrogenase
VRPAPEVRNEDQKKRFLAPLASGKKLGCFGLTEPAAAPTRRTCRRDARKHGDHYVVNGAKNWITNGPHADAHRALRRHGPLGGQGRQRVHHREGHARLHPAEPRPQAGHPRPHSCTVFFENCRVPSRAMLGAEGDGFKIAMATLDGGRIGIAAQASASPAPRTRRPWPTAKERKAFGEPIAKQAIQFKLADMATELDAARLLTLRAAT